MKGEQMKGAKDKILMEALEEVTSLEKENKGIREQNELLKAQIELYKTILGMQAKLNQPQYIPSPYPVYPNSPWTQPVPTITWDTGTAVAPKFKMETWC